ncbi:MAG: DUF2975 domain-containing protein [Sphingobacteriales bacterium]|nr:DUF2975 domain-containing protein [Sphingobacteriales bacterium]
MLKRKFKWTAIFIMLIGIAYFGNLFISFIKGDFLNSNWGSDTITIPTDDTAFRNAFFAPSINDSLPYYEYRKIQDSFTRIKADIETENKGRPDGAHFMGFIGFTRLKEYQPKSILNLQRNQNYLLLQLDSLEKRMPGIKNQDSLLSMKKKASDIRGVINRNLPWDYLIGHKTEYFITFRDIRIKENNHFFVQNGNYYLAHAVWDSTRKADGATYRSGHYVRLPLKVRYDKDQEMVLIPASRAVYNFLQTLFTILMLGFFIVGFYILIGLPVSILGSVSNGQVFTLTNIHQLRTIYIFLFILSLLKAGTPLLVHWIISFFTPTVFETPSVFESLYSSIPLLIAGLVVFLISTAFQKGYKLQQEEDFTV